MSEATALPTEPQPEPHVYFLPNLLRLLKYTKCLFKLSQALLLTNYESLQPVNLGSYAFKDQGQFHIASFSAIYVEISGQNSKDVI